MSTNRLLRASLVSTLLAAAVTIAGVGAGTPSASAVGSGTVSGKVFNDKNVNGAISTTGNEGGVEGVTVKAYDSAGNVVGTATTGPDGTYTLNVSGAATNDVRIEFSSTTGRFVGSVFGPDNGTDVQFVTLGTAAASKVNYGVQIPGEFCAANNVDPLLVVVRMSPNSYQQGLGGVGNCYNGSVMTFPWYGHSVPQEHPACDVSDSNFCNETKMLNNLDTGAVYGLAYDKVQSLMWTSAFVRRHAGLGPKGVGGLYVSKPRSVKYSEADMVIYNQQEKTDGPVASFDLTGAPWNLVLKDPSLNLSDAARGLDNSPNPDYSNDAFRYSLDAQGFDAVGKQGIGDIAIDSGKGHLFLTNLYQKKIQRLAITGTATAPALGSSVSEWSMPSACSDGTSQTRPFGLYFNEDNRNLWVGIVCTKEGTPVPTGKTKASQQTGLVEGASIWELNPVSGAWTKVTDINLKYPHRTEGCPSTVEFGVDGMPPEFRDVSVDPPIADLIFNDDVFGCWNSSWHAWTGDWTALEQRVEDIRSTTLLDTPPVQIAYGQPMISGISRLGDGSIVVGITDRLNFQTGYGNLKPNTVTTYTTALTELVAVSGDILLVCKTDSGYVQESGGGCASTGSPYSRTYSAANRPWANLGFAGENLEFFADNLGDFTTSQDDHLELSNGSVAIWPPDGDVTKQQVAFTAMDPAIGTNTSGVRWSSPVTGNAIGGESLRGSESGEGGFDKSANLGNLEIICDAAPIQIGNRVWQDLDGDGIQDPGEPALEGVTVHLYDADGKLVGTAVTDAKGQYYFSSNTTEDPAGDGNNVGGGVVKGGTFTIKFDNPADYAADGPLFTLGPTTAGESSDPTAHIDSDVLNGTWPYIPVTVGGSGQIDQSYDAGFGPVESVGSRVWVDADKDGIQDTGEPGFPNAKVELLNPDGSPALGSDGKPAVTYTDAQGNYVLLVPVPPPEGQQYKVKFTVPNGVEYTEQQAAAGTSKNDSNPDPATGLTPVFTLAASATGDTVGPTDPDYQLGKFGNPTIDAGVIVNPVAINGVVRFEKRGGGGIGNPNSQEDAFDPSLGYDPYYPPVSGVIVGLYDENGNPVYDASGKLVEPTYTNGEGNYWFDNLLPGKYKIKFTGPDMSGTGSDPWSPQYATNDPSRDSNADPSTGWTDVFDVLPGPGTGTQPNAGDTRATTGDDPVTAPYINDTIDALLYNPYRVRWVAMGSKVWYDDNKNGIQDPGEDPVEGVKVELLDPFGGPVYDFGDGNKYALPNEIGPTYTDEFGEYFFTYLVPGRYTARFTAPNGSVWTQQFSKEDGADSQNDSNADPNTGLTPVFSVDYAAVGDTVDRDDITHIDDDPDDKEGNGGFWANMFSNPTIDAGLIDALVGVGDYTWIDSDLDGLQDDNEPVLPGVTVELYDKNDNLIGTTTTDENGYYFFDGLTVGEYWIQFTPPAGYAFTSQYSGDSTKDSNAYRGGWTDYFTLWSTPNPDGSLPDTDPLTEAIWADHTIDAGFVPIVAVGDYVWFDSDRDGVQDTKEKGIADIWVYLKNPDGTDATDANGDPVGAVQTDGSGYYFFDNLVPGDYRVYFDVPSDYTVSPQFSETGNEANDSNVNPSGTWENYTPVFTVYPTVDGNTVADTDPDTKALFVDPTIDAGIYGPKVGFGNYVWVDTDADGFQDGTEQPLPGVKVELTDADGNPVYDYDGNLVVPTVTDASGKYLFDNLVPGAYRVRFVPPPQYALTWDFMDTAANDSNADPYTGLSNVFTVAPGAANTSTDVPAGADADFFNPTIDAGVVPRVAMGNYTWIDYNRDGIQDPTEYPLQGVKVELYNPDGSPATDADGNPVPAIYTDGNGYYLFDNLRPGNYKAQFTLPQGYVFTDRYSGTSSNDSNANPASGWTDEFTIDAAVAGDTVADTDPNTKAVFVNPTIDAGVVPLVAVGDYVWYDINKDGKQSAGEPPIAGVEVQLLDKDGLPAKDAFGNTVPSAYTDGSGKYLFDDLLPGTYRVKFVPPAGYSFTTPLVGVNPEINSDARITPGPDFGISDPFEVKPRDEGTTFTDNDPETDAVFVNPTIDAGMFATPVAMGDYVWIDADLDGIQDGGELPIAGVKVELLDPNGNPVKDINGKPVAPVFTNASGYYFFDNLAPASYTARFTPPAGYGMTQQGAGADRTADSNADPYTGVTDPFSIWPSATGDTVADTNPATKATFVNPTIDAGVVPLVAIGNYTWIDLDADGKQDVGEPVLANVKVELLDTNGDPALDADGNPVAAVFTDANGYYFFDNLLAGTYKVKFTPPAGYTTTSDFQGTDSKVDSNPDPVTRVTPAFTVAPSESDTVADTDPLTKALFVDPTIDAGFIPVMAVGNYVWYDLDADGVQDATEAPIEGVKVELFNSDGTAATDADGNSVAAVFTDENGKYLFDNLKAGDYYVKFTAPTGYSFTSKDSGSDRALDSNAFPSGADLGKTPVFSLYPSATNMVTDTDPATKAAYVNPTIDAGLVGPPLAVGNYVWLDTNADGVQGAGEPPVDGVKVELFDANGNPAVDINGDPVDPVFTDGTGKYVFDNLPAGTYTMKFTPPAGYAFTKQEAPEGSPFTDSNPALDGLTPPFELKPSFVGDMIPNSNPAITGDFINPSIDAGLVPVVAVGNYVWLDQNADGKQTDGEPGIPGAKVELLNPDGTPALDANGDPVEPVLTDASGYYLFDNLPGGTYQVKFTPPYQYGFTTQFSGSNKRLDSNADRETGLTPPFTVTAGAVNTVADEDPETAAVYVNPTIDAGLVPVFAVGNYVWYDTDKDGIQDTNERGLGGVGVQLLDENGDPVTDNAGQPVPIVYTDDNGFYLFDNLLTGTYKIKFLPPAGFSATKDNEGTDDAKDSDVNGVSGTTAVFTLAPGAQNVSPNIDPEIRAAYYNPTIDAGFIGPVVAVGDYVWVDANRNGIQESNEPPIAGVGVELLDVNGNSVTDVNGNPVLPTTTNAGGYYVFDNIPPGQYRARFTLPSGYLFTQDAAPLSASDNDSNPDPNTGLTPVFTVGAAAGGDTVADTGTLLADFINPTIDAGVVPRLGLGDYVWIDSDRDGIQDPAESPLPGTLVELYDAQGNPVLNDEGNPVLPATTDAKGFYFFDKLPPGNYTVKFTPPSGYVFTTANAGADSAADSNPNKSGWTSVVTLGIGEPGMTPNTLPGTAASFVNRTIDAGVVPVVAVGDYTWFDTNQNGVQDKKEKPAAGIEVQLFDANGIPAVDADGNTVPITFTDATGKYLFDNLLPGDYQIRFTAPWGYWFTENGKGKSTNNSNAYPSTGYTPVFRIEPRAAGDTTVDSDPATRARFVNRTIDAGFYDYELPPTGGDAQGVSRFAALFALLGLLLVLVTVRRRRTATA